LIHLPMVVLVGISFCGIGRKDRRMLSENHLE
jgi:hypothetical protein